MDRLSGGSASGDIHGEYKPMIPPQEEGLINQKLPNDMIRSILSRCHVREQLQGPLTVCKRWSKLTVTAREQEINATLNNMKELLMEELKEKLTEEQKAKLLVICAPKKSNDEIYFTTEGVLVDVGSQLLDLLSSLSIKDINALQKYIESKRSKKLMSAELKNGKRIDALDRHVFDELRLRSEQIAVKSMPAGSEKDKKLQSIAYSLLKNLRFDEMKSAAAEIQDTDIKCRTNRQLCSMAALCKYKGNIENAARLTNELFPEMQHRALMFDEISQKLIQSQVNSKTDRFEEAMRIIKIIKIDLGSDHALSALLNIYVWLKFVAPMKRTRTEVFEEQATQVYKKLREELSKDEIDQKVRSLLMIRG
jgi:hypothetical protein